jgi:hypothetical protein
MKKIVMIFFSFATGFLLFYLGNASINYGLYFGSVNSTSCNLPIIGFNWFRVYFA